MRSRTAAVLRSALVFFLTFGLAAGSYGEDEENFLPTPATNTWLSRAEALAHSRRNAEGQTVHDKQVTSLHLLAVLDELDATTKDVLKRAWGVQDIDSLASAAREGLDIDGEYRAANHSLEYSGTFSNTLARAGEPTNGKLVAVEHLAKALAAESGVVHTLLSTAKTGRATMRRREAIGEETIRGWALEDFHDPFPGVLINRSKKVFMGRTNPVTGRHSEVQRMLEIMNQRAKNNPILVGEPGTGKTTLADGLAWRILNEPATVTEKLRRSELFEIDLDGLKAGTGLQGELEKNLKRAISNVQELGAILFMDEVHRIVANSGGSEADSVGNRLKPVLTSGDLKGVMGATTISEYRKYIESDEALERRFQLVIVNEPNAEETLNILRARRNEVQRLHGVFVTDEALRTAVEAGREFIHNRFSPDREIQLLNAAASRLEYAKISLPAQLNALRRTLDAAMDSLATEEREVDSPQRDLSLRNLKRQIAQYEEELRELPGRWETATELRRQHQEAVTRDGKDSEEAKTLEAQIRYFELKHPEVATRLGPSHIFEAIADATGLDREFVRLSPRERMAHLQKLVQDEFQGNEKQVRTILSTLFMKNSKAARSLQTGNKDSGTFALTGAQGTGKTKFATLLAKGFAGRESQIVEISCSQFTSNAAIDSYFLGASSGYVGYEEGSEFTKAVRAKPNAVIVFKDVEGVTPEAMDHFRKMLKSILQDRFIDDRLGKRTRFPGSIIVFESVLEAPVLQEILGMDLSRYISFHTFGKLEEHHIERMVDAELKRIIDLAQERSMVTLEFEDSVRESLIAYAKSRETGVTGGDIQQLLGEQGALLFRIVENRTNAAEDDTGFRYRLAAVESEDPKREPDFKLVDLEAPHNCREDLSHLAPKEPQAKKD